MTRPEAVERGRHRGIGRLAVEVDPEDVLPGPLAARPRLELAHVEAVVRDDAQDGEQRARLVADRDDDRRPAVWRRVDQAGPPVSSGRARTRNRVRLSRQVADLVGEDLQAEQGGGPRRQDRGGPALAGVDDGLAGPGRVVRREELPRAGAQERLGLAERLDVRVDALDVVEPLSGERGEAERDRHDDLAADREVVLEQQVVVLADRAVDDVLDRDDAGGGGTRRDGLEDRPEAAQRGPRHVAERREDGVLGEGAGLAGVGDDIGHGGRKSSGAPGGAGARPSALDRDAQPYRLNQSVVSISPASSSSSARRSRASPARDRFRLRGAGAAGRRGLRRAAPVRLGEHRVERHDVRLDRGGDDVRSRSCLAHVLALPALPADRGRRDPDRDGALRVGPLAERSGCRRRAAAGARRGSRRAPCRRPGTARRSRRCPRPTHASGGRPRR